MWVTLLGIDVERMLADERRNGPASALTSFLNLTLFRARMNWLDTREYRGRHEEMFEPTTGREVSTEATPDLFLEAKDAIDEIVRSLQGTPLTEVEILLVVEGLRDGLTQAEIAASLGKTPQTFHNYVKRIREAA